MTPSDIDKALAEALGERVCGGTVRRFSSATHQKRCEACGEGVSWGEPCVGSVHLPPPPYSTSWEAAGRLVEEMHRRGWRLGVEESAEGRYEVVLWRPLWDHNPSAGRLNRWDSAPTFPEALSKAALRALGERGEGERGSRGGDARA
jgi:hypothetical protein